MPKRKDPRIPIRVAVASTQWPGATAQEVEQLVSRPVEQTMAQNPFIRAPLPSDFGIRSISFPGLSLVYVQLDDSVTDTKKQFGDINLKLNALNDSLPQGAGPIQFNSDFGDTAALMLTVASPPADRVEIAVRASLSSRAIRKSAKQSRERSPSRVSASCTRFQYRFRRTWCAIRWWLLSIQPRRVEQSPIRTSFKAADSLAQIKLQAERRQLRTPATSGSRELAPL